MQTNPRVLTHRAHDLLGCIIFRHILKDSICTIIAFVTILINCFSLGYRTQSNIQNLGDRCFNHY